MWKFVIAFIAIVSATHVSAESYKKSYTKGSWTLYRVDGMEVKLRGGSYEKIDDLCLAAFTSSAASLKFAMASASAVRRREYLRDFVWVQVSSEKWDFRKRNARAGLSVGVSSYTERSAQYDGFTITFGVPDFKEDLGIFLMFAGVRSTIDVLNNRGSVIARLPANGFAEVRDKMFACAGV